MTKNRQGFTLVELMIVVVIIGIVAAVAIPSFLSRIRSSGETIPPAAKKQTPSAADKAPKPAGIYTTPQTLSADIRMTISPRNFIRGLEVFTLYDADFRGEYVFAPPHAETRRVKLFFPFPESAVQATDVSLEFKDRPGGDTGNTHYSLEGITWYGTIEKDTSLTAVVTCRVQGRDQYLYDGPGARRAGRLSLSLALENVSPDYVPAFALQPTGISPGQLTWEFENMITDRPIVVELPGAMSPIGRSILILRLAGLAVFLFGLGFMYLNDLVRPGRLDGFRWGHFLLLAMNYSLFFVLFTLLVTGSHLSTPVALVVSALVSLPLLMFHVARSWGRGFALTSVLPLTLFTAALVFNGVYGGGFRLYGFLALFVAGVIFFTLTYQVWTDKRAVFKKEIQEQQAAEQEAGRLAREEKKRLEKSTAACKEMHEKLSGIITGLDPLFKKARGLENRAAVLLKTDPPSIGAHRDLIENCLDTLAGLAGRQENLKIALAETADVTDPDDMATAARHLEQEAGRVRIQLGQAVTLLGPVVDRLNQALERGRLKPDSGRDIIHCIACGSGHPLGNFCPDCGIKSPARLACENCGDILMLPLHNLGLTEQEYRVCCLTCGRPHAFEYPHPGHDPKTE